MNWPTLVQTLVELSMQVEASVMGVETVFSVQEAGESMVAGAEPYLPSLRSI